MTFLTVVKFLTIIWGLSEIFLALSKRARGTRVRRRDRGTQMLFWLAIIAGVSVGGWLQFVPVLRIAASPLLLGAAAFVLLGSGVALRWWAMQTLGRFFTANVALLDDHRLVTAGPYRSVRHPAYAGMLLAFAGLGVSFGSWLSLVAVLVPVSVATLLRIHVEEKILLRQFGEEYRRYCRRTRRLIPGLY